MRNRTKQKKLLIRENKAMQSDLFRGVVINAAYSAISGPLHANFLQKLDDTMRKSVTAELSVGQFFQLAMDITKVVATEIDPFSGEVIVDGQPDAT